MVSPTDCRKYTSRPAASAIRVTPCSPHAADTNGRLLLSRDMHVKRSGDKRVRSPVDVVGILGKPHGWQSGGEGAQRDPHLQTSQGVADAEVVANPERQMPRGGP